MNVYFIVSLPKMAGNAIALSLESPSISSFTESEIFDDYGIKPRNMSRIAYHQNIAIFDSRLILDEVEEKIMDWIDPSKERYKYIKKFYIINSMYYPINEYKNNMRLRLGRKYDDNVMDKIINRFYKFTDEIMYNENKNRIVVRNDKEESMRDLFQSVYRDIILHPLWRDHVESAMHRWKTLNISYKHELI